MPLAFGHASDRPNEGNSGSAGTLGLDFRAVLKGLFNELPASFRGADEDPKVSPLGARAERIFGFPEKLLHHCAHKGLRLSKHKSKTVSTELMLRSPAEAISPRISFSPRPRG